MRSGEANTGRRRKAIPRSVEKVLFSQSGNQCSYPGCPTELTIEKSDGTSTSTGVIAHICAVSPGGPRFDHSMSESDVNSEANLVLLCPEHHTLVDTDVNGHPVVLLRRYKYEHVAKVRELMEQAMGTINFAELEVVCKAVAGGGPMEGSSPLVAPVIKEKLDAYRFSQWTMYLITLGLMQSKQVSELLESMTGLDPSFAERLRGRFLVEYDSLVADGANGDDLFLAVLDFAERASGQEGEPRRSRPLDMAALAVVSYLFEICDLFEGAHNAEAE